MMSNRDFFVGAVFGVFVGASMTGLLFGTAQRAELIHRGLAGYCATDGRFAFNGECGE